MSEPYWVPLGGQPVDYEGAWAAGTAYLPGDVVRYAGIDYLAVNPSTGLTPPTASLNRPGYGTSLPASPSDGEEYILTNSLTAPAYTWRFRYNAGSTWPYKWDFIGGAPWIISPPPYTPPGVGAYYTDTAPAASMSIPRVGDWLCETGADLSSPTPSSAQYLGFNGTDRVGQWAASGGEASIYYRWYYPGLGVGSPVQNVVYCTTTVSVYSRRLIGITPVRVA